MTDLCLVNQTAIETETGPSYAMLAGGGAQAKSKASASASKPPAAKAGFGYESPENYDADSVLPSGLGFVRST